jgi:hypothetical protein
MKPLNEIKGCVKCGVGTRIFPDSEKYDSSWATYKWLEEEWHYRPTDIEKRSLDGFVPRIIDDPELIEVTCNSCGYKQVALPLDHEV